MIAPLAAMLSVHLGRICRAIDITRGFFLGPWAGIFLIGPGDAEKRDFSCDDARRMPPIAKMQLFSRL